MSVARTKRWWPVFSVECALSPTECTEKIVYKELADLSQPPRRRLSIKGAKVWLYIAEYIELYQDAVTAGSCMSYAINISDTL